jgi:mRNA interferase RelE/StbE
MSSYLTLRRLPKNVMHRIASALDDLALEPRPAGCKKLTGLHNHYRIRVGGWRIIYTIEDDILLIVVIEVGPRGDVHRNL